MVTRPDHSLRDPDRAVELAERALAVIETEPMEEDVFSMRRAATLDTHAEALFQVGRYQEALLAQQEAVSLARAAGLDNLSVLVRRLAAIEEALSR